jgi:magnesium chelatase family protein
LRNCGIQLPNRKIILNLAPSNLKKIGTAFDLPMAVGLLALVQEGESPHHEILTQSLFF